MHRQRPARKKGRRYRRLGERHGLGSSRESNEQKAKELHDQEKARATAGGSGTLQGFRVLGVWGLGFQTSAIFWPCRRVILRLSADTSDEASEMTIASQYTK